MTSFSVEQHIGAAPDRIWAILTDAPRLVGGGLGITRIEGAIRPGARLKLLSEASPKRAFSLRVAVFEPPTRMTWEGGMPFGLFKGVRSFALEPVAGGTRFLMREEFTGALAPMITKSIPDLTPSFKKFALGLKTLAETGS
ncbi:MAG: SRPBCC domain-containing protein [Alphaproteobacteria bacterium]|nr:SRPBCC domain-containing protein [Alphaproteobacteria bacterium]